MRYNTHLILAAAFVLGLFPVEAAMMNQPARDIRRADVMAKSTNRNFSGAVQSIAAGGLIRLRDDRLGDINLVITAETRISKSGGPAEFRNISVGGRIHGYASFRGGKYFAKGVTINS
jgi:hypothetical protein